MKERTTVQDIKDTLNIKGLAKNFPHIKRHNKKFYPDTISQNIIMSYIFSIYEVPPSTLESTW